MDVLDREAQRKIRKHREELKRRKMEHAYAITVLALGAIILFLIIYLLFFVQRIEVEGNKLVSDDEIISLIRSDKFSGNSLCMVVKYGIGLGKKLPVTEKIRIKMVSPWRIKVVVTEKKLIGYVYSQTAYAYFDKKGKIVYESRELIDGLPSMEGIATQTVELGDTIKPENPEIFDELLNVSELLTDNALTPDRVACTQKEVFLYFGNICVDLGEHVTSDQMAQIQPILSRLEGEEGTLYLQDFDKDTEIIPFKKGEFPQLSGE
ncbi:MAG: hypothetical protein LBQ95_03280 [Lachnospiraceae bacterium]|jgi:cell division protein FtsQ|nr:hypothetical protein [Lachnospiraceae bacterium]